MRMRPELLRMAGVPSFEHDHSAGSEIFGEAEPSDFVYVVRAGAVRQFKIMRDGRRQVCAFRLPGDAFGFELGEAYRFSSEAITATRTVMVRRDTLMKAVAGHNELAVALLGEVAHDLQVAEERILSLGRKTVTERVTEFLVDMQMRCGADEFVLPMTRRDISDYLGLALETVSRTLNELQARGLISFLDTAQRHVVIADLARLRSLQESAQQWKWWQKKAGASALQLPVR